jgi:hypothetical protein
MQLAIGQIQIVRAQLDGAPDFEAEEAEDARALGQALLAAGAGGGQTVLALEGLKAELEPTADVRAARMAIHSAIDRVIRLAAIDGTAEFRAALAKTIIEHQTPRTIKDRKWFEPMGFDAGM